MFTVNRPHIKANSDAYFYHYLLFYFPIVHFLIFQIFMIMMYIKNILPVITEGTHTHTPLLDLVYDYAGFFISSYFGCTK